MTKTKVTFLKNCFTKFPGNRLFLTNILLLLHLLILSDTLTFIDYEQCGYQFAASDIAFYLVTSVAGICCFLLSHVTVWQACMSVCTRAGLSPCPMVILSDLAIQLGTSVNQPIRSESNDLMSEWVLYSILNIITPPLPVCLLLLGNLLGYWGPTTVKPALCLDSTPGAWDPGWS